MAKKTAKRLKITPNKPATAAASWDKSVVKMRDRMREGAIAYLLSMVGRPEFLDVLDCYTVVISSMSVPEQERVANLLREKIDTMKQRTENGQVLASEGRAAKTSSDQKRAVAVCRLYRMVRGSFPAGGAGNAQALREVAARHQRSARRDRPLTVQAIRKILQRQAVECR